MSENERVAASVATLLIQDKKILLGRRFFANEIQKKIEGWQCPGGYLQKGESVEQAARRICLHKAGIEITGLRAGPYSNNVFSSQLHTVTLYIIAEAGRVVNAAQFENLLNQWSWFSPGKLPRPLYLPLQQILDENKFDFSGES